MGQIEIVGVSHQKRLMVEHLRHAGVLVDPKRVGRAETRAALAFMPRPPFRGQAKATDKDVPIEVAP